MLSRTPSLLCLWSMVLLAGLCPTGLLAQECVSAACERHRPAQFIDITGADRQLLARGASSLSLTGDPNRCYKVGQTIALATAGSGTDRVRWGWGRVLAIETGPTSVQLSIQVEERLLTDQVLAPDCQASCDRVLVFDPLPANAQILDMRLPNQIPHLAWPGASKLPIGPSQDFTRVTVDKLSLDPSRPIVVLAADTQVSNRHVLSVMKGLKSSGAKDVVWGYGGIAGLYNILRPFPPPVGLELLTAQEALQRLSKDWQPVLVGPQDALQKMKIPSRLPAIEIRAGFNLNTDPQAQLSRHFLGLDRLPEDKRKQLLLLGYDANQRWTGNLVTLLRSRGYVRVATVAGGWLELNEAR